MRTCGNNSKCNCIKYWRHFLNILLNLCNLHQILNISKKKITLVVYIFSKLPTVKGTVTQMFKKHRVIAPFYGQHVKRCKTSVKFSWGYFYRISLSLWAKGTWENYFLLIFELLRVFIETLTLDHKYCVCYIWNLKVPYQMHLSKKPKTFSQLSSPFLKSSSNFKNLEKNNEIRSQCFSEIIDCQKHG